MDSSTSVIKCYVDVEAVDKTPALYNYVVLSAHVNKSLKLITLSRSVVKQVSTGCKFIMLAILRTKCIGPRYDAVLMDLVNNDNIFRVPFSKFRKEYRYDLDEYIESATCDELFLNWLVDKEMVWDKTCPNKLEDGTPDTLTFQVPELRPSRFRKTKGANNAIITTEQTDKSGEKKKKRKKTKKSLGQKAATTRASKEKTGLTGDGHDDGIDNEEDTIIVSDSDGEDESEQELLKIASLEAQINEKRKLKAKKEKKKRMKLEQELAKLAAEEEEEEEEVEEKSVGDLLPLQTPLQDKIPLGTHSSQSSLPGMSTQKRQSPMHPASSGKRNKKSWMQAQILQNQAIRIADNYNARLAAELQLALYESFVMNDMEE